MPNFQDVQMNIGVIIVDMCHSGASFIALSFGPVYALGMQASILGACPEP